MATSIKSIPVLKSKDAKSFNSRVSANKSKKSSIAFTKQVEIASKILAKAKF